MNKCFFSPWRFSLLKLSLSLIGSTPLFCFHPVWANPLLQTVDSPLKIVQLPASRALTVETIQGVSVEMNRNPVKIGDRAHVGDSITTGRESSVSLRIDSQIGLVELAENTTVKVITLSDNPDNFTVPITVLSVSQGQVRFSISRFVSAQFRSPTTTETSVDNSPFKVETPVAVVGVRGTTFGVNVAPDGKTSIQTIEGVVGIVAAGEEIQLEKGRFSIINPTEKPSATQPIPALSQLQVTHLLRLSPTTVQLRGEVDPMDLVYIDNQAIETDIEGKFEFIGRLPASRRLKVVVRGPSVRERHYIIPVL